MQIKTFPSFGFTNGITGKYMMKHFCRNKVTREAKSCNTSWIQIVNKQQLEESLELTGNNRNRPVPS